MRIGSFIALLLVLSVSCNEKKENGIIGDYDIEKIRELHENYRKYWLENDSAKVVNLFADEGALIPPQNPGDFVLGKKSIGKWWFGKINNTTYPITEFVYDKDTLLVVDRNTAIFEGVSTIGWDTLIGDSLVSSNRSSSNYITICVRKDDDWKILRQIWNVRPTN